MFKPFILIAGVSATAVTVPAQAIDLFVVGTGTYLLVPPSSPLTSSLGTWRFTFVIPDTISSNPSTQITNFTYSLNNIPIALTTPSIEFFTFRDLGMFDLKFADGLRISLTGSEVLQGATITTGYFPSVPLSINGQFAAAQGSVGIVTYVPEPATWAMFAAGVVALGGAQRRRRNVLRQANGA